MNRWMLIEQAAEKVPIGAHLPDVWSLAKAARTPNRGF
jgi:hypothetical protein